MDKLNELRGYKEKIKGWKTHLEQTHQLQQEVNLSLTELAEKLNNFEMPVRGQNDNSGGVDVELLAQELEKTKQELRDLQDKLKEFEKLTDEIGVEMNAIGNKPQEIHEQQKETKNLVADVSIKVLAIIGAFSGVYWLVKGVKSWIIKAR